MSMYQDKSAPLRRIADITPEQVAAHVREAQRLRSLAVASVTAALARRLRRALRRGPTAPARKVAVGRSL